MQNGLKWGTRTAVALCGTQDRPTVVSHLNEISNAFPMKVINVWHARASQPERHRNVHFNVSDAQRPSIIWLKRERERQRKVEHGIFHAEYSG